MADLNQITLGEALKLVWFRKDLFGKWYVAIVKGDCDRVDGTVYDTINGRKWQYVETPKKKLQQLINETGNQELIDAKDLKQAMRPEKDGFVEGRNYLANRVAELEKALNELMDVCAECDGWESFPSRPLDKAHSVLNKQQTD